VPRTSPSAGCSGALASGEVSGSSGESAPRGTIVAERCAPVNCASPEPGSSWGRWCLASRRVGARRRPPCTVSASNPEEGCTKCPTTHSQAFAQSCKSGLTRHRKRYLACAPRSMPSMAGAQAPPAVRRATAATRRSQRLPRWRTLARSQPGEGRSERVARQRPQVGRSEVHRGRDAGRCGAHRAARTKRPSSTPLSGCPARRRLKSGPQPASRPPLYREK
jgi:hypothetical protein